jgi:hypothetical protein
MWAGFVWLRLGFRGARVLVNTVLNLRVPLKVGNIIG